MTPRAPVAHPRAGQPPGHRQHRERGAHRQELRDRAHAAGGSRGVRSLAHRGHRAQHGRLRGPDRDPALARGGARRLRVVPRADRPGARRQAADAAARARPPPSWCGSSRRARWRSSRAARTAGSPTPSSICCRTVVTIATDPRASVAQPGAGGGDHGLRDAGTRAGGEALPLKPPRQRGRAGHVGAARDALRRLAPGALGHRLLQDPPTGERDALVSRDRLPRRARRPRSLAGPRDGHRGRALSPAGRRAARRTPPDAGTPGDDGYERTLERLLGRQPLRRRGSEPAPDGAAQATCRAAAAARFRALRTGLLELDGVAEAVRFMGAELALGLGVRRGQPEALLGARHRRRALGHLHPERCRRGPAAAAAGRVPADIARAIDEGQRTGPVKWCWLPLDDRRAVDDVPPIGRPQGGVAGGAAGARSGHRNCARSPRRPAMAPRKPTNSSRNSISIGLCNRMRGLYFGARLGRAAFVCLGSGDRLAAPLSSVGSIMRTLALVVGGVGAGGSRPCSRSVARPARRSSRSRPPTRSRLP